MLLLYQALWLHPSLFLPKLKTSRPYFLHHDWHRARTILDNYIFVSIQRRLRTFDDIEFSAWVERTAHCFTFFVIKSITFSVAKDILEFHSFLIVRLVFFNCFEYACITRFYNSWLCELLGDWLLCQRIHCMEQSFTHTNAACDVIWVPTHVILAEHWRLLGAETHRFMSRGHQQVDIIEYFADHESFFFFLFKLFTSWHPLSRYQRWLLIIHWLVLF